jgi:hypothetical protein
LTLVSYSSTQIVADLPTGLAAGTYRLAVNSGSAMPGAFDVAYGAVAPQGPAGTVTLPFNGTASGADNSVFNIINTTPEHTAIGGRALSGVNTGGAIWISGGKSPTSSRKIVPPFADSKRPSRRCVAPVKAPSRNRRAQK